MNHLLELDETSAHPTVTTVVKRQNIRSAVAAVREHHAATDIGSNVLRNAATLVTVEDGIANLQVRVVNDLLAPAVHRPRVAGLPILAIDQVSDTVRTSHSIPHEPRVRARAVSMSRELPLEDSLLVVDCLPAIRQLRVVDLVLVSDHQAARLEDQLTRVRAMLGAEPRSASHSDRADRPGPAGRAAAADAA